MPERHPIAESPTLPLARRVQLVEIALARLWDQVWWMSLAPEQREAYRAEGFGDPIEHFYIEDE